MIKFKAVSHRLIFWILCSSASLFILISFYEQATAEYYLREQIRSKAKLVKLDMVTRLQNLLHTVSDNVHTAAAVLPIVEADQQTIEDLLKKLVKQQQDIYGMAVALEPEWSRGNKGGFAPYFYHSGNGIAYSDLSKAAYHYRGQPWYRDAVERGHATWSEPYFDEGGGNTAMVTYSSPIYTDDADRVLVGVVTADIALSSFAQLVSQLALGEKGFAYIFTHKGNIITHSISNRVMGNVIDKQAASGNNAQYRSIIRGMQKGQTETLQIDCTESSNGECWLSYQPVAGTNWSIAILIPMDELSGNLMRYRYISLAITTIGLLLLALVVIFLSKRLTRPLLSLTESSKALARGELDTAIDDYQLNDEVGTLARQFRVMQSSLKRYIKQLNLQTAKRERLEGELSAAHDIQMQMLPDQGNSFSKHRNWSLSAMLEPAKSVGGDFYHYHLISDSQLFFAVGDVSDKGVAAALFMAKTQTLLRQLCQESTDPGELLTHINQQLCQDNSACMFVTLVLGTLDTQSGVLNIASAGHNPPLLHSTETRMLDLEPGPALGFFPDTTFSYRVCNMPANSQLILTTDGVDEASNYQLQQFGEQRLLQAINSTHSSDSNELLQSIYSNVVEFRASAPPSDDLTIMIISRY